MTSNVNISIDELHESKLKALEEAFLHHKAEAINSTKINDCSLKKIAAMAKVSTSMFSGEKPITRPDIARRYLNFKGEVIKWKENFQGNKEEFELASEVSIIKQIEDERDEAHSQCAAIYVQVEQLKKMISDRDGQVNEMSAKATDVSFAAVQNKSNRMVFDNAKLISVDDKLYDENGIYQFGNHALRDVAWEKARHELVVLLKRSLSTRVYMLVGMPGAGKTEWTKGNHYYKDTHSVVIDTTNLTISARAQWLSIIMQEKYKPTADIKICAVVFDTPYNILTLRNKEHRQIDDKKFLELFESMQKIDIPVEGFEEVIVVRYG